MSYVPASEVGRAEAGVAVVSEDTSLVVPADGVDASGQGLSTRREQRYGTFRSGRSIATTSTRSQTPAPSEDHETTAVSNKTL